MKTKMPTSLLGYIQYLDPSSLFGNVPELKPRKINVELALWQRFHVFNDEDIPCKC
jgi:hypothetical protein